MTTTKEEKIGFSEAFTRLENSKIAKDIVLKELSRRVLLESEFAERAIEADDREKLFEAFCTNGNLNTEEKIERFLQNTRTRRDELQERLLYQNKIDKLKAQLFPFERIREVFLATKPLHDQISFSMISVDTPEKAKDIYEELINHNRDFSELARIYSVADNARNGGMVGPLPMGNLSLEMRRILSGLKLGEISEPFSLDSKHFMLVQVNAIKTHQLSSVIEMTIRTELFEQWLEQKASEWSLKFE